MRPTNPQYHYNTITSFTSAMPSTPPTKLLKGHHLLILLEYLWNQCLLRRWSATTTWSHSPILASSIFCCQIAVNRSYTCYDIKMGKSINFKSVWGIWGLQFAVKNQKSLKRRNLEIIHNKPQNLKQEEMGIP